MSEAEYLDSIYPYTEEYISELRELKRKVLDAISEPDIELMKATYEDASNAKTGDKIICPFCGEEIIKKSYQQKFCCTKHKDKYWNIINPRGIMKGAIQ